MAFQFPNNPNLGDKYEGYAWMGSYWARAEEPLQEEPEAATYGQASSATTSLNPSSIGGSNNTLINLTIPIDLGQLLNAGHHGHSDFDYIAPE